MSERAGRERAYPGLPGEAPQTRAFYALAAEKLAGARRVLDAGCGAGNGARRLAESFDQVIALDRDRDAIEVARRIAPAVTFAVADFARPPSIETVDAAVIVDVLGHAANPFALLRAVHARLAPGGRIVVAEARAYPTQLLREPARRAFSPAALEALLGAAGFDVEEHVPGDGPFVACVARAAVDPSCEELSRAARALAIGDVDAALAALERASSADRRAVRVEALVSLGELRLARGEGDAAARAFMAARAGDSAEPRATAGLARITLAMGDVDDAVALARIARSQDAACPTSACALAMALAAAGQKGPALGALREASALAPDDVAVAMGFAESAAGAGQTKPAIFAMERARRYGNRFPAGFHVLLAELLLEGGRAPDALLEARCAAAGDGENAAVAALLEKLGA